jgi:hypothetical protein
MHLFNAEVRAVLQFEKKNTLQYYCMGRYILPYTLFAPLCG